MTAHALRSQRVGVIFRLDENELPIASILRFD